MFPIIGSGFGPGGIFRGDFVVDLFRSLIRMKSEKRNAMTVMNSMRVEMKKCQQWFEAKLEMVV